MTDEKEIPQGWQREGNLLYTAEQHSTTSRHFPNWHNRMMVSITHNHGDGAKEEAEQLAAQLYAFLATPTPASPILVGDAAAEPGFDSVNLKEFAEAVEYWAGGLESPEVDESDAAHLLGNLGTCGMSVLPTAYVLGLQEQVMARPAALPLLGSRDAEVEELLTRAAGALAGCYDVTEYPANGETDCDKALRAIYDYKGRRSAAASTGGGASTLDANKVADWLLDHGRTLFDDVQDGEDAKKVAAFAFAESLIENCAAAPQHLVVAGAVPDELLSAYCDLAASHDDALPITAEVEEGLVGLYHNDGTPIEADQRLADFVAAACNAAGAGFRKDLAAFGQEDAAPQHIVVAHQAPAPEPWCARCPATEKDVNSPGFRCDECDSLLGINHEART